MKDTFPQNQSINQSDSKLSTMAKTKEMIQRTTGWVLWSDETKIQRFGINSTRRVWRRRNAAQHHPPPSNMEVETLCSGGVFLLRGQYNCTTSKGWWTDHVPSGQGHWKWVVDGYSSMTMTQNTRPSQQRSGTLRSWSGLASLQTFIP